MVNAFRRSDNGPMRRSVALVLLFAATLAACATPRDRDLARYYDPEGLFTASLPTANTISVATPQPGDGGPGILSGVISQPPAPSPSPQSQLGGGIGQGLSQTAPSDQTIYEAFVVTTDVFDGLSDMSLYFLTGDPTIDLREQRPMQVDGMPGRLIVADSFQAEEPRATVAVAMSLGRDGTGYLVAAIFPPGDWETEEADFLRVVGSFRAQVAPGLLTFPVTSGDA